tara:strand:+ start:899 stop:2044 length:1146 start_codon:yes stop_codon:yes gene_type:complete
MQKPLTTGYCDTKFKNLYQYIQERLASNEEMGCSISAYLDGVKVIDFWGGWADKEKKIPWQHDTISSTFSVSKALVSTMGHILVDRGIIELDCPVYKYWSNFGKNDKKEILVRHLFDHRCAISYVDKKLNPGDLYNWELMINAVENTKPNWPPGEKPVYLNMTYGYLLGGLVYKLTGKRIGQFNRDHLCGILGIDYNFALRNQELKRVAKIYSKKISEELFKENDNHQTLFDRTMQGFAENEDFNSLSWQTNEVGSGQGHGNARSISNLFEMLRSGGIYNNTRIMKPETIDQAIQFQCSSDGNDPVMGIPVKFALGYQLNSPHFPMGPNPNSFGHWGAGGSFGFADLEAKVSFGYCPNLMHNNSEVPELGADLTKELYQSI